MDWAKLLIDAPMLALHGMLISVVYLLWKRQAALEKMLIDCLQTGGKVEPSKVDSLDSIR